MFTLFCSYKLTDTNIKIKEKIERERLKSIISTIEINDIQIQLYRKAIKNLRISILPPDGVVRVSAPRQMSDKTIRMTVVSRFSWIKKHQDYFLGQPKQSDYKIETGEYHLLWGKPYLLNVVEWTGKNKILFDGHQINLYVRVGTSTEKRGLILNQFYRDMLKIQIDELMPVWLSKMGVEINSWHIKKMKTRWGSCNITAKRIWLSLALAKKPVECLEYVLVHELVHLFERNHNERFKAYMDQFLPDWRDRNHLLNKRVL